MPDPYWKNPAPPGDMRVAKGYNRAHGFECSLCGIRAMSSRLFKSVKGLAVCRDEKRCANRQELASH